MIRGFKTLAVLQSVKMGSGTSPVKMISVNISSGAGDEDFPSQSTNTWEGAS